MARFMTMILITMWFAGCGDSASMRTHEEIRLGDGTWRMELAMTDESIARGLMGRESLPKGEGMLFIFPDNTERSFWMANCLINIDLLYLDGRGVITSMHRMKAEPPRDVGESELAYQTRMRHYRSGIPVRFAIEVPEGTIDELSLAPNQKVDLDVEGLKELRSRADSLRGP